MAQAADTGGSGFPYAKLTELGDTLVGAFASSPTECRRQVRDYESGKPLFKDAEQRKPKLEEVMYFIALPETTAKKGNADSGFELIEALETVCFSVDGFKWGQVIDARKALPPNAGFKAGQPCSGDIYTITLVGWSAETKNPAAAEKAGFTVVDGRIVLKSQEDKDKYVLQQSRNGGNTNPAKDLEITIRRPTPQEKAYEQAADELFLQKPWQRALVAVGGGGGEAATEELEPF